jgi:DNA helicase-2/ATP-dependent DNA helicase PcrA
MTKYSAQEIFSVVSKHKLTDEQEAAISSASTTGPSLVIAGAGSGKTELMSVRTLYLVANELAKPSEILGLTFTRKAASELATRVQSGLVKLRESSYWPKGLGDDFDPPKITTYNSFGNEIFRSLSLQVGFEADAVLLTEAGAISLAREVVANAKISEFSELLNWDKTLDYLTEKVLSASGSLTDNQQSADEAVSYLQDFAQQIAVLPQSDKGGAGVYAYHQTLLDTVHSSTLVFELARQYQSQKKSRGLVDFSDQVALALRALEKQDLELSHKFVLLDEYQDTSGIQTMLLSRLFAGKPVMAVGDPNQAIYGWRGASSANLSGFAGDFGAAEQFSLSTSWRSGQAIVDAANLVSEPLQHDSFVSPVSLTAGLNRDGTVSAIVCQDDATESARVALWLSERMNDETSAAVLFRSKQAMRLFADALENKGLEVEITGLSGLLEQPEVLDLLAALRVIADPEAGSELMRILSGPKFRIAPRDIAQLHKFARKLTRMRKEVTAEIPLTLVEALDEIRKPSSREFAEISEAGLERMVQASELFHLMRTQLSLGVSEFSWAVARELELDIELYAHARTKSPLANLEGFIARISDYEVSALRPSVSGLLGWLDYAVNSERFEMPKTGAKAGVVQLMSVHAAKGLEWDFVAVAGLVQGSFPVDSRDSKGWLAIGKLPHEIRQDRDWIPQLSWRQATTQKQLKAATEDFASENRSKHDVEERRLAYVAITRAGKDLLLSASYYKAGILNPRPIAPYLEELINAGLAQLLEPIPEPAVANPLANLAKSEIWPSDPLGNGRASQLLAAETVATATPTKVSQSLQLAAIIEQAELLRNPKPVELPLRLSASKIVQLLTEPEAFWAQIARPLPVSFSQAAARGTQFHERLEEAFDLETDLDISDWQEQDQKLGQAFLDSRFNSLEPLHVEQALEFELGGTVVVCKLDAVYQTDDGFEVVDWKSGSAPKSKAEVANKAVQLALYRIGLSRWLGVGVERVKASFFFAGDAKEISPEVPSEKELVEKLRAFRKAPLRF